MASKGTGKAAKSSTGAAMSKYDVEVESRLQALESAVRELQEQAAGDENGIAQVTNDSTADHEKLLAVETALNKVRGVLGV